jgi:hypothetical protein
MLVNLSGLNFICDLGANLHGQGTYGHVSEIKDVDKFNRNCSTKRNSGEPAVCSLRWTK